MATIEQVAQALNLSRQRVYQLVAKGMPQIERGKYDLGRCMLWYIHHLQDAIERRSTVDGDASGHTALTAQRGRLMREKARGVEHRNEEAIALYVPAAHVRMMTGLVADSLRDLSAGIGSRVTADVELAAAIQAELDGAVERHAEALSRIHKLGKR